MHLKAKWREHPLFEQGVIELVPTEWLWQYWGRDVSSDADLMDGTMVDLEMLWENMVDEGLYNPLIMRVGLENKKFRLETGNHRTQVLHKHHMALVPVTVQVKKECGPHTGDVGTDATHNFGANGEFLISEITNEYMPPSKVFKSLEGKTQGA